MVTRRSATTRRRAGVVGAMALGLLVALLAVPASAQQLERVGSSEALDWAFLRDGASFGPNLAAFDDTSPDVVADDEGVAHLQHPDVVARVLAGERAASVEDLIVLVTFSPDAVADGVEVGLANGDALVLNKVDATPWQQALGGAVPGLESTAGFDRTLGSVVGAAVRFSPGLGALAPSPGDLIATLRLQFLNMTAGMARVDLLGLGANGRIAWNNDDSGGAVYEAATVIFGAPSTLAAPLPAVPEPATWALAALSLLAIGAATARRRGSA